MKFALDPLTVEIPSKSIYVTGELEVGGGHIGHREEKIWRDS